MSASPSTVLVPTEPVIEGTIHEGELPPTTEAPEGTEVPTSTEARIAALKALWAKGTADEESAWMSLSVARVLKSRVAYLAGALGSKNGEPNNKAAMRILDLAQNSVRPYFLAGQALAAAGFEMSTSTPTASEMAIVDPIVSKAQGGRKAPKADAPDAGTSAGTGGTSGTDEAEEEAGVGSPTPAAAPKDSEPVTFETVFSAVEHLQGTLARFTREQGFSGVQAENLQAALAEMGAVIETYRVDGGDS